jgi:hypothetical protein
LKCSCGKEVGLRIWCEECEAKHIQVLVDIQDRLKKATEKFKKATTKLQFKKELNLYGYNFTKIVERYHFLSTLKKNTREEVFEWEFYTILKNLLEVLEAFESGRRLALKAPDYYELLGTLKQGYDLLKGNIGYLKREQEEE